MTTNASSGFAALGRLVWIMIGPMILFILTVTLARQGGGWFTTADFAFFIVLGGLVLGRWMEFRGGGPLTATGEPATTMHLRRYVSGVLLSGMGVWFLANLVGNYL